MERLTSRMADGTAVMAWEHEEQHFTNEWVDMLQTRLAAYEDTGLEPCDYSTMSHALQQAKRAREDLTEMLRIVGAVGLDRLMELAKAEREGRLVVLPCKVGDTVWLSMYGEVKEAKVVCIRPFVFQDKVEFRGNAEWTGEDPFYNDGRPLTQEVFIVFDKDAFLTREEAESALEKGESGNG